MKPAVKFAIVAIAILIVALVWYANSNYLAFDFSKSFAFNADDDYVRMNSSTVKATPTKTPTPTVKTTSTSNSNSTSTNTSSNSKLRDWLKNRISAPTATPTRTPTHTPQPQNVKVNFQFQDVNSQNFNMYMESADTLDKLTQGIGGSGTGSNIYVYPQFF